MADTLALALAQINPTVGDVAGNLELVRAAHREAAAQGADLVVYPELAITGYPPDCLVPQRGVDAALAALAADIADGGPALLVGAPIVSDGERYNAASLIARGRPTAVRLKHALSCDEQRVFAAGPLPGPINFRGVRLGAMIGADMATPDVTECLQESGAELLVALTGSPFEAGRGDERLSLAAARVIEATLPLIYLNRVGDQDEPAFDGASFVLNADASLAVQMAAGRPQVVTTRWRRDDAGRLACTG